MATSGVKRIKISSIDREGNDNSSKFLDLEEIIINHPKGIDDINNIGVSGSNILGGSTPYSITNTRQNVNNFLFTTIPTTQNSTLTQTITPDLSVYATFSGDYPTTTFNIGVLTTKQNQSNASFRSPEVQWDGNWYSLPFTQNPSNPLGWLTPAGTSFQIKDIPPHQFKIKIYGKITRIGSSTPPTQSLYALISDYGASAGVLNFYSSNPSLFNSIFPLGYLPPQSILISASNGQDQNINFEFIVTQSYSRILNKPIGPSYGPTTYTLGGSSTATFPSWYFYLGASTGSVGSVNSELFVSTSGLFLEITPYPPSTIAPTVDIMNTSSVSYSSTKLYAGNVFTYAGVDWIVIVPEFTTGVAEASLTVGNIDTWVKAGYISAYNITNFPSNSFYNTNSIYKGFRAASLLTTSSYIPLIDTDENYNTSEFNPLINNVDIPQQSNIFYDLDYSNGISSPLNLTQINQGSAEKAKIDDSNYSRNSWIHSRYKGSRITSPGINQT